MDFARSMCAILAVLLLIGPAGLAVRLPGKSVVIDASLGYSSTEGPIVETIPAIPGNATEIRLGGGLVAAYVIGAIAGAIAAAAAIWRRRPLALIAACLAAASVPAGIAVAVSGSNEFEIAQSGAGVVVPLILATGLALVARMMRKATAEGAAAGAPRDSTKP